MTATTARAGAGRARLPERSPRTGRDPAAERREGFRVLGPRELAERARRRAVGRLAAASVGVLVVAMLAIAGAQALVASRQLRVDALQQGLANAVATNEQLSVRRAQLEAPTRILAIARGALKMSSPGTVSYLAPVDPGPPASARAASVPVPPAVVPLPAAGTGSPAAARRTGAPAAATSGVSGAVPSSGARG